MNEKQEHFLLECVAYALVAINPRKHHDILSYVFNKYKKLGEDPVGKYLDRIELLEGFVKAITLTIEGVNVPLLTYLDNPEEAARYVAENRVGVKTDG